MPTDVFHAIAHPARRELLDRLSDGEHPVNALAEPFPMSRPAVSQHLKVLRDAGLVVERRVGRERRYQLRPDGLQEVQEWVSRYDRFWMNRLDRLGAHMDRTP